MSALTSNPQMMALVVTQKQWLTPDLVRLRLERSDAGVLPAVLPGTHLALDLAAGVRRYSLLQSGAALKHYDIGVLCIPDGRGGSREIHEQVAVGDVLQVLELANDFPLDTQASHTLLIGGGVGITPLLSMARWLHEAGGSFALHQIVRSARHAWPLPHWLPASVHVGRATIELPHLLATQPADTQVYVCGPAGLAQAVHDAADASGWAPSRVHTESFGASVAVGDVPLRVTLALSGLTLDVAPGRSLLDALLAEGIWTSYECRRGICGACLTEVTAGQPIHRDSLSPELRGRSMCTCVSWAQGPALTLNL